MAMEGGEDYIGVEAQTVTPAKYVVKSTLNFKEYI